MGCGPTWNSRVPPASAANSPRAVRQVAETLASVGHAGAAWLLGDLNLGVQRRAANAIARASAADSPRAVRQVAATLASVGHAGAAGLLGDLNLGVQRRAANAIARALRGGSTSRCQTFLTLLPSSATVKFRRFTVGVLAAIRSILCIRSLGAHPVAISRHKEAAKRRKKSRQS